MVELKDKFKTLMTSNIKDMKLTDIHNGFKGVFLKILLFINKNKRKVRFMVPLALAAMFFAGYMGYRLYSELDHLNQTSTNLAGLEYYNTNILKMSQKTQQDMKHIRKVSELIQYQEEIKDEVQRYEEYVDTLQIPFEHFLQYIYLPRLNIRKDSYLGDIDTSLIGINFLEKNPYNDVQLLQTRSDFFKRVGENESNQITSITVGDVKEDKKWYFKIPITVGFISNSKRAFLLLIDKLSVTSNEENISLINEFTYFLRNQIKKENLEQIENIAKEYIEKYPDNKEIFIDEKWWIIQDKVIAFHLHKRIFEWQENKLFDDKLLNRTMKKLVSCEQQNPKKCDYLFRDKFRAIPQLAYLKDATYSNDRVEGLRQFYSQLPPIIEISDFTFDKLREEEFFISQNTRYEWRLTVNIYGKWIEQLEVDEIADLLGEKCFQQEVRLSPNATINIIENIAEKTSLTSTVDTKESSSLRELHGIIKEIWKKYENLSNYQKIIRLFEIYRMLDDGNICEL